MTCLLYLNQIFRICLVFYINKYKNEIFCLCSVRKKRSVLSLEELKPLEDIEKFNKFLNSVPGLNHAEVRDELMAKIGKN